jgi:hypothetical protein
MKRINLSKNSKEYLVLRLCVYYRKGMTIDSAANEVFEDYMALTAGQAATLKKMAVKELKANSDWRY